MADPENPQTKPTTTTQPETPAFNLTSIDHHQLTLSDSDYKPHTWENLKDLIASNQLEELKRFPSQLRAYLDWSAHVKSKYGSVTNYLLTERLHWQPLETTDGGLTFAVKDPTPFASEDDYLILRNDWPYGVDAGISHVVVWLKAPLEADEEGALTRGAREAVEAFVERVFRGPSGEGGRGERVMWFKNTSNLQSVRGLEHVHVLVRDVDGEVLGRWMK